MSAKILRKSLASLALLTCGLVHASTYDFHGTWLGGPLTGNYSGSFSYDPSISSLGSDPTVYAFLDFSLDVFDDASTVINFNGAMSINENAPATTGFPTGSDIVQIGRYDSSGMAEASVLNSTMGGTVRGISIDLIDQSGSALTDETIPSVFDVSQFGLGHNLVIKWFDNASNIEKIQFGTLAEISERAVVPIPAAAWLFASALGVFGYLGKKRKAATA